MAKGASVVLVGSLVLVLSAAGVYQSGEAAGRAGERALGTTRLGAQALNTKVPFESWLEASSSKAKNCILQAAAASRASGWPARPAGWRSLGCRCAVLLPLAHSAAACRRWLSRPGLARW